MDSNFVKWVAEMNALLQELSSARDDAVIEASMNVSFKMLELLTSENVDDAETIIGERILTLPNSERQDGWFQNHPWMAGAKSAFDLFNGHTSKIQAKFYWLRKRSSSNLVGAVHFTPNWEDHDYTRNENFKVGLDFFLTSDADGVIVALSNRGRVRVMELNSKLSNTQVQVLQNWWGLESLPLDELHAQIWESFRLQEVNSRFYRGVSEAFVQLHDSLVKQGRPEEDSKMFASRLLGRLIFVWFLRKMNLIDSSIGYFDASQDSGDYYRRALERLFFRTLNSRVDDRSSESAQIDLTTPYLNGGLFSPRADDWYGDETLTFPQDFFVDLYAHFDEFNFTTDESTPEYEQVAIDPEMLGRVFESLLASQIEETGEQARKAKGAFYTPREIVAYMCRESVREYLTSALAEDARAAGAISKLIDTADHEWAINGSNSKRDIPKELQDRIGAALRGIKTIDPACGSGAFPLGLLQLLTKLQLRLDSRLDNYKLKLSILQDNIFGSDIEPMAVEISRLRSWLSLIVEEQGRTEIQPLPNLEFNFVCANSLLKLKAVSLYDDPEIQNKLAVLREKFFSTSDPSEKLRVQRKFIDAINPDLIDESFDVRGKQLKTYNPFDTEAVAAFFDPEYMFGIDSGFDIVIGNPPYISALAAKKSFSEAVRAQYKSDYRSARGAYDIYLLFLELGLGILKQTGTLVFITPTKLVSAKYAETFRAYAKDRLVEIASFDNRQVFESAGVSTLISSYKGKPQIRDVKGVQFHYDNTSSTLYPRQSLEMFPENLWGHLLGTDYELIKSIYGNSVLLESVSEVVASSTAAEADAWSRHVSENIDQATSAKMVNTGTISRYWPKWGISNYANKGEKLLKPLLDMGKVGERRRRMFQSPKLVIGKLSKKLTAMLDQHGEFASSNTVFVIEPVSPYSLELLAAILNSRLMNHIYGSVFSGLNMLGSFQYQAPQIRLLPIPKSPDREVISKLQTLVGELLNTPGHDLESVERLMSAIDHKVFELYGLTNSVLQNVSAEIEVENSQPESAQVSTAE